MRAQDLSGQGEDDLVWRLAVHCQVLQLHLRSQISDFLTGLPAVQQQPRIIRLRSNTAAAA